MLKFFVIFVSLFVIGSCQTRRSNRSMEDIADFSLSGQGAGVKVDDREYFDDLQRSESAVGFESSFPLPISVGRAVDPYDVVPSPAKKPTDSVLSVQLGSCSFRLKTGPIQVDRYLLAGQWIKLTEGLPSGLAVKLEPDQDLNLKIVTQVIIEIGESQKAGCRKLLEGKRVPLGRFHMNRSKIGLLNAPKAPKVLFSSRSMEPKGKMISIRWARGASSPTLIDDFDFPATCESGIFRAVMSSKGFYHLTFQPALRMDQLDQVVIKLPYPPGSVKNTGSAPAPSPAPAAAEKGASEKAAPSPVAPAPASGITPVAAPALPSGKGSAGSGKAPALPSSKGAEGAAPALTPAPSGAPALPSSKGSMVPKLPSERAAPSGKKATP